ncbi:hypothetical protein [Arthrobacter subterraneus]|uniref:hypothetical protein n=1 Tax=Arthrobacter subterraneus TaxID=335973 RepID=UPI00381DAF74
MIPETLSIFYKRVATTNYPQYVNQVQTGPENELAGVGTGDPAEGGLGYSQAPVVVYAKDGTEDHWSGLNPTKISHVIALATSA